MKKSFIFIFIFLCLSTSIQTKAEPLDVKSFSKAIPMAELSTYGFNSHSLNEIVKQAIKGQKKEIQAGVAGLIDHLHSKNRELYPTNLKIKNSEFFQLLETAKRDSSALIDLGKIYFLSAMKNYKNRQKLFQMYDGLLMYKLEYLIENTAETQTIVKEWYLSLVFFSLAGFYSDTAKNEYISAFYQFQLFQDSFFKLYKLLEPDLQALIKKDSDKHSEPTPEGKYFQHVRKFQPIFNRLQKFYFEIVMLSFHKLSWIHYDLTHYKHPEMFFEYGRILNKAYGGNYGLSYIYKSENQGYFPAVKYLLKSLPNYENDIQFSIKKNLSELLKNETVNLTHKLNIALKLFFIDMREEKDINQALKKGSDSLKKSCKAMFKHNI